MSRQEKTTTSRSTSIRPRARTAWSKCQLHCLPSGVKGLSYMLSVPCVSIFNSTFPLVSSRAVAARHQQLLIPIVQATAVPLVVDVVANTAVPCVLCVLALLEQTALAAVGCMTTWMEIFKELSAADARVRPPTPLHHFVSLFSRP